ncbi:hypothetical protein THAOC_36987, partial [Thalassiosira oceanica]
ETFVAENARREGREGVPTVGTADHGVTSSGGVAKSVRGHCMMFIEHPDGASGKDQWGGNLSGEEISERKYIDPSSDNRVWIECTSIRGFGRAYKQSMCAIRRRNG